MKPYKTDPAAEMVRRIQALLAAMERTGGLASDHLVGADLSAEYATLAGDLIRLRATDRAAFEAVRQTMGPTLIRLSKAAAPGRKARLRKGVR